MDPAGSLDSTTWAALALTLTVIGAVLSWVAWRRRGPAAGLRGLGWTLLPVAAWLTGTLRLRALMLAELRGKVPAPQPPEGREHAEDPEDPAHPAHPAHPVDAAPEPAGPAGGGTP